MNLLVDTLPSSIEVHGKRYSINTDFRACLRVILAFEDNDLTGYEKQMIMLANLYPQIPPDMNEAARQAGKFLNGGGKSEESTGPRLYSFSKDASLIFAAFRQTHHIDLEKEEMHWWKFLALFMDLGQDTAFCNLVGMRHRFKTGRMSKEERRAFLEMGDMADVPQLDDRTLEEKEMDRLFEEAVAENMRKRDGR